MAYLNDEGLSRLWDNILKGFVKKKDGKGLSTNDFTNEDKEKVASAVSVDAASVGQTIIVKEVDENGKPTAWEAVEYQPRTHWMEEGTLYEGTPEFDENGESQFKANFSLTIGKTYKVIWNNTEYICEAKDATSVGFEGGAVVGNLDALLETGDTGEPFIIGTANGYCLVLPFYEFSVTLSIIGEKATPIPMCYIPEYVYRVDVSQFADSECYQSGLPKALILAAYDGIPLYLLVTDENGRAVKMPASFSMPNLAIVVGVLDEYADPIPSSSIGALNPILYARGTVSDSVQDWRVRFVDSST